MAQRISMIIVSHVMTESHHGMAKRFYVLQTPVPQNAILIWSLLSPSLSGDVSSRPLETASYVLYE